jgi:serine/threonine-protein kinase RsbW
MNRIQKMLSFSSNPCNVSNVINYVDKVAQKYNIAPDLHGDILLSVTEAVNNAIVHGNCCDESKTVEVQCKKNGRCLAFHVTDKGHGFDHNNVADPTAVENIYSIGGRGVHIMRALAHRLDFENGGSTVKMKFNL